MSRSWCFTLNNPGSDSIDWPAQVVYAKWQKECVSTPHLQGYVEFDCVKRLPGLKKILPTAHWEPRRGSQSEAIAYVSKEESRIAGPWEHGTFSAAAQGARSDLKRCMDAAAGGSSTLELMEMCPAVMARYASFVHSYKKAKVQGRVRTDLVVKVYFGPTGTGKSRRAFEEYPCAYRKSAGTKWFDGYVGQSAVIWDDFESTGLDYRWFLTLLDIYPVAVEVKGSMVDFEPNVIVVTTNVHPKYWFPEYSESDRAPLLRRITEIVDFSPPKLLTMLGGVSLIQTYM